MTLEIVYQDAYLVAIHKPAGLLVHKSPIDKHETRFAMKLLRDQIGQWVYPLHRLDKPTSGLLLFALCPDIASQIGKSMESREIYKTYLAIVRGFVDASGIIDHPLKELADFKHQKEAVEAKPEKPAQTTYSCLKQFELPFSDGRHPNSRYSLVELNPTTGRKHQLRRHLKHISHPIIGDVKYGKGLHNKLFQEHFSCRRLLLAATELRFTHPITQQPLHLLCPLETDFSETLSRLSGFTVA